ncbi:MAG: hypothetical protein KTR31_34150 [Myxococcales bacterium]|nr:hypothetical protein [Myxococcales bacterium]
MRPFTAAIGLSLLSGCAVQELPQRSATERRPGVSTRSLALCVDGDATQGFASFVLSDVDGVPVTGEVSSVAQTIDGDRPGSGRWEGGQSLDQTDLDSNLHVTLVLDASRSIVDDGLFDDMRAAAQRLLEQGDARWAERPGTFTWRVLWFNQWVWEADSSWTFDDIPSIPAPQMDDDGFTRMYAAIDFSTQQIRDLREAGVAAGDRDNHLLVVFTDGRDNSSGRVSPEVPFAEGTTETDAEFAVHRTPVVTEDDVIARLEALDFVQVSLLALGDDIDDDVLDRFADAGRGQVFAGDDLERLFTEAERSFETLKTVGWRLPLNPGELHDWQLDFSVDGFANETRIRLPVMRDPQTPDCVE